MTFSPTLPLGGYAGWRFLVRTSSAQTQSLATQAPVKRDLDYFRQNIGKVKTADQLVSDRRLLSVALGAFGLGDDINNKAFIRKVLSDGTIDTAALANRLADKRYLQLSKAFGFGDFPIPNTQMSDFAEKMVTSYTTMQFESAVGEQDPDLRLALDARRELGALASTAQSENTKWYSIMGSTPLRAVFQQAFGLPSTFATIDIDQQLGVLKDRASEVLGSSSVSQFSNPDKIETLIKTFLLRSTSTATSQTSGSAALTLLQGGTQYSLLSLATALRNG